MENVESLKIPDIKLISLKSFGDARGFFVERFKQSEFLKFDLPVDFPQDNFSRSAKNVLRGLHYQWEKPQGKLVTCLRGVLFDVAVDIRKNSPTFGEHVSVELHGDRPQWLWIPPGFAHGFCVVSEEADLYYKCTAEYNPQFESGILWADHDIKIAWPTKTPILSARDEKMQSLKDYEKDHKFFYGAQS
jgi:dTDP-4-dehydrorhamnose 3,5-epimerase